MSHFDQLPLQTPASLGALAVPATNYRHIVLPNLEHRDFTPIPVAFAFPELLSQRSADVISSSVFISDSATRQQCENLAPPTALMSGNALMQFEQLEQAVRTIPGNSAIFVVRAYYRTEADFDLWLPKINALKESFPQCAGIVFVVPVDERTPTPNGGLPPQTERSLSSALVRAGGCQVPIVCVHALGDARERGWTRGLNVGIGLAHSIAAGTVCNMSFESEVPYQTLNVLSQRLLESKISVTIRETPSIFSPAIERWNNARSDAAIATQSEIMGQVRDFVMSAVDGSIRLPQGLGDCGPELRAMIDMLVILSRNTFACWDTTDLVRSGGFDPNCNFNDGMEDTKKLLELMRSDWNSAKLRGQMESFNEKWLAGFAPQSLVSFTESRTQKIIEGKATAAEIDTQSKKFAAECAAVFKILKYMEGTTGDSRQVSPDRADFVLANPKSYSLSW